MKKCGIYWITLVKIIKREERERCCEISNSLEGKNAKISPKLEWRKRTLQRIKWKQYCEISKNTLPIMDTITFAVGSSIIIK